MSDMQEWKDMEDMIKRVAEKEPLPDSLAPEEIEKKLRAVLAEEGSREEENRKQAGPMESGIGNSHKSDRRNGNWKRKVPRWGTLVAACFTLLAVLSVVLVQSNLFSKTDKSAKGFEDEQKVSEYIADAEKKVLEEVLVGASSEEEIFERIDRIKNPERYRTVGERIMDGFAGLLNVVSDFDRKDEAIMDSVESESSMNYGAISDSMDSTGSTNGAYAGASGEKQMESAEDTGSEYSGTNLQEQGVDEADVVKTDGKYFYIKRAQQNEIAIVKVDGEQMSTVSQITLPDSSEEEEQYLHEFYVLGDKLALMKTVYIYYASEEGKVSDSCREETRIMIYDITDRQTPNLISELSQDGAYDSSRMNGGYLYTFSDHYIYNEIQIDKPESYIPCAEGEVIACEDIYLPEQADSTHYKVITSINLDAPESIHFQTEKAVLCGSGLSYVSTNAIYFLAGSYVNQTEDNYNTSEIWKFSYQDGNIIGSASGTVKGDIRDQFAMSEANGYLRVVTTYYKTEPRERTGFLWGRSASSSMEMTDDVAWVSNEDMKNGLYILDENLNVVGSLEDLAPGEQIYSARFFTDTAYFVTFRQTDPLFSVDVSDPTNPVLLGELKIPGFSEYLHPYGEGRLLGIGYAADDYGRQTGIKLSMFDVSDPSNVKEIATKVIAEIGDNSYYSSPALYNHKAVLVDVGKNLIGCNLEGYIYASRSETENNAYVVYGYEEGQGFFLKHKTELTVLRSYRNQYDESYEKELAKGSEIRGAYIGNYFYTINEGYTIQCFDMEDNFALKSEYEY